MLLLLFLMFIWGEMKKINFFNCFYFVSENKNENDFHLHKFLSVFMRC